MAKRIRKTSYVRCRGGSPLLEGIDRMSLPRDCSAILELYPDGISKCRYGCLGGGSCEAACHLAAIRVEAGGPPAVDKSKCVGCGLCVRACPQNLIEIILPDRNIQPKCSNRDLGKAAREACGNSCISCRICERECPAHGRRDQCCGRKTCDRPCVMHLLRHVRSQVPARSHQGFQRDHDRRLIRQRR